MCNIYTEKYIFSKQRYNTVYKEYVVENAHRNKVIVLLVKKLTEQKRIILITVTMIKHGRILLKLIKKVLPSCNVKFLYSNIDKDMRLQILDDMRNGKINVLIGTSLADEGLDIPVLDTLILAGAGKSVTRIPQRIGRVLRKFQGKKNALIFDFHDNVRYLRGQVRERTAIYSREPEFNVVYKDYTRSLLMNKEKGERVKHNVWEK